MRLNSKIQSESYEQICLVNWFREAYPECLMFAIPNGGLRARRTAQTLKLEGVTAGIPDLCILAPNSCVLWIELKRTKGGAVSKVQKDIIVKFSELGQEVHVCRGYLIAKAVIINFMENTNG